MQALSRHLRPAPYPYGLLTLRLLGKLGGKNREFLRDPINVMQPSLDIPTTSLSLSLRWRLTPDGISQPVSVQLPVSRCLLMLKKASRAGEMCCAANTVAQSGMTLIDWEDKRRLWDCSLSEVDFASYDTSVARKIRVEQAEASMVVATCVVKHWVSAHLGIDETEGMETRRYDVEEKGAIQAFAALLYAASIKSLKERVWEVISRSVGDLSPFFIKKGLVTFLSDAPVSHVSIATDTLKLVLPTLSPAIDAAALSRREKLLDECTDSLCSAYATSIWTRHVAYQPAILFLVQSMDSRAKQRHQLALVNTAFVVLRSIPRELSSAGVRAVSFAIRLCTELYGVSLEFSTDDGFLWDPLPVNDATPEATPSKKPQDGAKAFRPNNDVIRLLIQDLCCADHLSR